MSDVIHVPAPRRFRAVLWSVLNSRIPLGRDAAAAELPTSRMSADQMSLAASLVASGACDRYGIERAWKASESTNKSFERALTKLSIVTERALAEAYSRLLGFPIARREDFPLSPVLINELKPCFLRTAFCCPLRIINGRLSLALLDGFDRFTPLAVAAKTGLAVDVVLTQAVDLASALTYLYPSEDVGTERESDLAVASQTDSDDLDRLGQEDESALVTRHINETLTSAVEKGASDLHFETFQNHLSIRFRHDGNLVDVETLPRHLSAPFLSRLKVMARLDVAEKRLPQDGRFKSSVRGVEINFRLATLPSLHGEKAVVRVLDQSRVPLDFTGLGYSKQFTKAWTKCLAKESGILLVVGPTGSGKSTTLYTSLKMLASREKNIATVEDPIEFQLAGINQTQIKPQIGLEFATCFRSILRQDPDVIMVGEIRDLETAQIAVQASMTGHLVLSTLHANTAAGAIARLRDLGLEDYAIATAVRAVVGQRLLRKLCECKTPALNEPQMRSFLPSASVPNCPGAAIASQPVGCSKCGGTGYHGRFAVAELIVVNRHVRGLIERGAGQIEIEAAMEADGFDTLLNVAQEAVGEGLTGLEEIASLFEDA